MRPFSSLTRRGKARRLRAMAVEALRHYEIDAQRIELVSNSLNRIFRVWATDGCLLMLHVSLPDIHSLVEIQSEMIWLEALARDTDIPAPRPVRNRTGDFVTTVAVDGVPESRHCAVCRWLYARPERPRVVHGDLRWWNVNVYRGRVQPLDFEDLSWGYPVQDIAISFYYFQQDERFTELRAAFRQGYERHTPWPEGYPGQIDLLIVHRGLDLMNFILSWPDDERERWIPHFMENLDVHYRARFEAWKQARDEREAAAPQISDAGTLNLPEEA